MELSDYFQMTMLVTFLGVFAGRTAASYLGGQRVFSLGFRKRPLPALVEVFFIPALAVWTTEIVVHALRLDVQFLPPPLFHPLFDHPTPRALGMALIFAGFILFVIALTSFGASWRVGIDDRNPGELVTGGIFSKTRNPIFVFLNLYFFGTFLIYPNAFFLLMAIVVAAGIHYQILQEESFLLERHGEPYRRYLKEVRRYL